MRRRADPWLLIPAVCLLAISILMVLSTTAISAELDHGDPFRTERMHIIHISLGCVVMLIFSNINPRWIERMAIPAAIAMFILLALVLIPGIGDDAGGARRWVALGPLRFQPGEMAKLVFVVYVASYIGRHHERMRYFQKGTLIPFGIIASVGALLLLEPDFGSTVILLGVVFFQLITVSNLRHLMLVAASGSCLLLLIAIASPYRFRRIQTFLDPFKDPSASGYQLIQSLIAVGSGGLGGVGLGAGRQKLFYLPAAHTDFIFAVIAEELGFLGGLAVVVLFAAIAYRGLIIAKRLTFDPYLASLAVGCTLLIVFPAFLNMGVVLGLFPTKGLVLPLVAYGGTAMIVHLAALGILLRLSAIEPELR